jgi:hypothetical protein
MSAARRVDLARLGLGTVALSRPDLLLRLSGHHERRGERLTVRVLGARYVLQAGAGIAVAKQPGRTGAETWMRHADAATDLVHAVTMLVLAAVRPDHRRLALISAVTALAFATADSTGAPDDVRRRDPSRGHAR